MSLNIKVKYGWFCQFFRNMFTNIILTIAGQLKLAVYKNCGLLTVHSKYLA